MEEEEEVVFIKVFDEETGDVVFEGKVSTDVEPRELMWLRCFMDRNLGGILNKTTNEELNSFKGLQSNVELAADYHDDYKEFSGVLYVGADGVLRKSKRAPLCKSVAMTVWRLSHEECEKVFKCETLEELEMYWCQLTQIPIDIGKMKKLKKLTLYKLHALESVAEEIGDLSSLKDLRIEWSGVESVPKKLKELKVLKSITLLDLPRLQLDAEDLVAFSKLKHLKIRRCRNAFTPSFTESFWEMIKSTTDLRVLELRWYEHDEAMVVAALQENGSIVDGGEYAELYSHIFKRNKENHERALQCILYVLAMRRWGNVLNDIPKEMVRMIAMMLWNTKCDVGAWTRRSNE